MGNPPVAIDDISSTTSAPADIQSRRQHSFWTRDSIRSGLFDEDPASSGSASNREKKNARLVRTGCPYNVILIV